MAAPSAPAGRVVRNTHHGTRLVPADARADDPALRVQTIDTTEALLGEAGPEDGSATALAVEFSTPFDYLFDKLAAEFPAHHLNGNPTETVENLKKLGRAMVENEAPVGSELQVEGNSTIPPVYTYWGQFIDHDITLNTDNNAGISDIAQANLTPLHPSFVAANLRNGRLPALNLDSLYGDGPTLEGEPPTAAADMYDGIALKLSDVTPVPPQAGDEIPPLGVPDRDLFRIVPSTEAIVGDSRNDENLIVAQLHVAFVRFHNAVLEAVRNTPGSPSEDEELFAKVRQLVTWHYQWLIVHDYLKTVTQTGVVDKVLLGGNKVFAKRNDEVYMPLEFSAAAYRFGHTMVRAFYDYNRNFGRKNGGSGVVQDFATFEQLFAFTGSARDEDGQPRPFDGRGTPTLPSNWVIEWDRFVDKGSVRPDHFARKIDTKLAPPLLEMLNQSGPGLSTDVKALLRALAARNLLRGYHLALPTGQAVAEALGIPALTVDELHSGNTASFNEVLDAGGFQDRTPLWYYVLKEAEVKANGNSLGTVGSRIVVETLIGQLREDPGSFLHAPGGWSPDKGVLLPDGSPIVSIGDLFTFAGVA